MSSFDRATSPPAISASPQAIAGSGLAESYCAGSALSGQVCDLAFGLAAKATTARQTGDEIAAERLLQEAVATAFRAVEVTQGSARELAPFIARWALEAGDVATARSLLKTQRTPEGASDEVWRLIADVDIWPDAWLIAAVRRSLPDEQALDALARRYWGVLFGRCHMLTAKREAAADLAQDTWCRVLRARDKLLPGGNFRAYLLMIATNLWRDSKRAAFRAGMLAADRMASLEDELVMGDGLSVSLEETLPDLSQLEGVMRDRLKQDLDFALGQLGDLSRDVLVARFLDGASCAEIGRRYGRTEQTASGWLRRALAELKVTLEASRRGAH